MNDLSHQLAECAIGAMLRLFDQQVIMSDNRIDILEEIVDTTQIVDLELKYPHADYSAVEQARRSRLWRPAGGAIALIFAK